MTHDELLSILEGLWHDSYKAPGYQALLAVVELHKPIYMECGEDNCCGPDVCECGDTLPCPTIEAIEKELG
jgi:hypothetical protein